MKFKAFIGMQKSGGPISIRYQTWREYLDAAYGKFIDLIDGFCLRAPFGVREGFKHTAVTRGSAEKRRRWDIHFDMPETSKGKPQEIRDWCDERGLDFEIYIGSPHFSGLGKDWLYQFALAYFRLRPKKIWIDATNYWYELIRLFETWANAFNIEIGVEGIPRSGADQIPARVPIMLNGWRAGRWYDWIYEDELPPAEVRNKRVAILREPGSTQWGQLTKHLSNYLSRSTTSRRREVSKFGETVKALRDIGISDFYLNMSFHKNQKHFAELIE